MLENSAIFDADRSGGSKPNNFRAKRNGSSLHGKPYRSTTTPKPVPLCEMLDQVREEGESSSHANV